MRLAEVKVNDLFVELARDVSDRPMDFTQSCPTTQGFPIGIIERDDVQRVRFRPSFFWNLLALRPRIDGRSFVSTFSLNDLFLFDDMDDWIGELDGEGEDEDEDEDDDDDEKEISRIEDL